jgi:SET domain-containing protein
MSLRAIEPGEELTIDYEFDDPSEKTPCSCGVPKCRGTIEKL